MEAATNVTTLGPGNESTAGEIQNIKFVAKHAWPLYIKYHGLVLVFAWLVLGCTSILFNRYYKNVWPKCTLWGKPMWFQMHRITMTTVMILTFVGVALAYAYSGAYTTVGDFATTFLEIHPPAGVAVCVLVVVNPFLAFFRPPLDSKYRKFWYFLHFSLGVIAYILANMNVYVAYSHDPGTNSTLHEVMMGLLYAYWALVCLTIVVLEAHKWYWRLTPVSSEQKPLNSAANGVNDDDMSRGGSTFLKTWLCVFLISVLSTYVVWCVCLFYHGGIDGGRY